MLTTQLFVFSCQEVTSQVGVMCCQTSYQVYQAHPALFQKENQNHTETWMNCPGVP